MKRFQPSFDAYEVAFEIPRNNLKKGQIIERGCFGDFFEALLTVPRHNRSWFSNVLPKRKIPVVMKTPANPQVPDGEKLKEMMFNHELEILCNVGLHPNVVAFLGAVTQNSDGMFIVMEKCSKGNLRDFLKSQREHFIPQFERLRNQFQVETIGHIRNNEESSNSPPQIQYSEIDKNAHWKPDLSGRISTAHLLSFAMQIAQGMEHLTSIKCIHRALIAMNILLTPEGTCKISDFGLAKRLDFQDYFRSEDVEVLPLRWMAPESLNENIFTAQSEIWSYGMVLYEIFTLGDIPYPHIQHHEVMNAVISGVPNEQPVYCPDEIFDQMKLCWSADKDLRPSFTSSAELMKKHLTAASTKVLQHLNKEWKRDVQRQKLFKALHPFSKKEAA